MAGRGRGSEAGGEGGASSDNASLHELPDHPALCIHEVGPVRKVDAGQPLSAYRSLWRVTLDTSLNLPTQTVDNSGVTDTEPEA